MPSESVDFILDALAMGTATGIKDVAEQSVKDACAALWSRVHRFFGVQSEAVQVLDGYSEDPDTWEKPLRRLLMESAIGRDAEIVDQAQRVLKLVSPQQAARGKYVTQVTDSQGIAIGDGAHIIQNFGER